MDLIDLLPDLNIENKTNEFKGIIEEGKTKEGTSKEDKWLKTLVGFANSNGGKLFIGVEDKTHKILSLDHLMADKTVQMIHRLIKQKIVPEIQYDIQSVPIKNNKEVRYVLIVNVPRGRFLPVGLKSHGVVAYYIRHFGETSICSQEELRNLFLYDSGTPFDSIITNEVYDPDEFTKLNRKYYELKNKNLDLKTLLSIGFIDKNNHISRGAMMFKDNYSDNKVLITLTEWAGLDKGSNVVIGTETCNGNLLDEVETCISFIKSHSVNGYRKLDFGRESIFSFPERAVFEGVVNAICHRNYWINGSQIEINIFPNRLEITSPGSLVSGEIMQKETNISSIMPERRNDVICNIFSLINYLEKRGSGFDKIANDYLPYGKNYQPYVSSNTNYFSLILPDVTYSKNEIDGDIIQAIRTNDILTGKYDEQILGYCYNEGKTISQIASKLNIKPSTYFRKEIIEPLINKGYLISNMSRPEKLISNKNKVFLKRF